jgi:hypothetical protein
MTDRAARLAGLVSGKSYTVQHRQRDGGLSSLSGKFDYAHVEDDDSLTLVFGVPSAETGELVRYGLSEANVVRITEPHPEIEFEIAAGLDLLREGRYIDEIAKLNAASSKVRKLIQSGIRADHPEWDAPAGAGDSVEAYRG